MGHAAHWRVLWVIHLSELQTDKERGRVKNARLTACLPLAYRRASGQYSQHLSSGYLVRAYAGNKFHPLGRRMRWTQNYLS